MTRRWDLHQGLRRLFTFEGSSPQAVYRSLVIACSNSSVEGLVNELYYRSLYLSRLKGSQLWVDISHCWPTYKKSPLYTSQDYDQCIGSSKSDHRYGCSLARSSGVNCDGSRLFFHIQILFVTVLLPRNQKDAIYSFLPSNKLPNRETKLHNRGISQSIYKLRVRWLDKAIVNSSIFLQ